MNSLDFTIKPSAPFLHAQWSNYAGNFCLPERNILELVNFTFTSTLDTGNNLKVMCLFFYFFLLQN